jgi:nucleoporin POM152
LHTLGDVFGQQISVSQARMVNVKNILQNSSHILGKHAVHILPYG